MSTTPVNIEASDKRVERSPAFLRHFWPGFDPPSCEIIASRQPQHLLPPSIVPVILYLSKKDGGRRVRGERRKNEKRRRKRWNESPVSKTSSLFIRSERLQLSDYAIYKRARYIESPMEEKRSREMQVDNDAGGYTGWVRAKKLEVEGWVKEIDIIWFILFYYFFFASLEDIRRCLFFLMELILLIRCRMLFVKDYHSLMKNFCWFEFFKIRYEIQKGKFWKN